MPLDSTLLTVAKEIHDRIIDLRRQVDQEQRGLRQAVRGLYAGGGSMREIAVGIGLSHQRVHQIIGVSNDGMRLSMASRPIGQLRRFTDRAQSAFELASTESTALKHEYIGTEHLLLALLDSDGVAGNALLKLGVKVGVVRKRVIEVVGIGECDWPPEHPRPLTARAKKVLDLATREARKLKHDYVGTEHVLLGLAAETESVGARVLRDLGLDSDAVRAAVVSLLAE
jgi:hypothetical protein